MSEVDAPERSILTIYSFLIESKQIERHRKLVSHYILFRRWI